MCPGFGGYKRRVEFDRISVGYLEFCTATQNLEAVTGARSATFPFNLQDASERISTACAAQITALRFGGSDAAVYTAELIQCDQGEGACSLIVGCRHGPYERIRLTLAKKSRQLISG